MPAPGTYFSMEPWKNKNSMGYYCKNEKKGFYINFKSSGGNQRKIQGKLVF